MILRPDEDEGGYVRMPSGLILPDDTAEEVVRKQLLRPTGMDFFCGCGGFSLGAIMAGIEVIAAFDNWPTALLTYATNLCRYGEMQFHFVEDEDAKRMEHELQRGYKKSGVLFKDGEIVCDERFHGAPVAVAGSGWIAHEPPTTPSVKHLWLGDVRKLTGKRILQAVGLKKGELGVIMGGPPCQGYSVSGKREVADPRNNLVFEFARMVVEIQPKAMCMEEVPGVLTMTTPEGVNVIDQFCRIIEDGSFSTVDAMRGMLKAQRGIVITRGVMKKKKPKKKRKPARKPVQADLNLTGGV